MLSNDERMLALQILDKIIPSEDTKVRLKKSEKNSTIIVSYEAQGEWFTDQIALETLWNCTVCVLEEDGGIRRVHTDDDVENEVLVFVHNIFPEHEYDHVIFSQKMVRFKFIK
jgi:hypothetical protein